MTLRPDIDINGINEALITKADTDLENVSLILPKYTAIFNGSISKGTTITFSEAPENFDYLLGVRENMAMVMTGKCINGRGKLCCFWSGVDSLDGGFYTQVYSIDFGNKNNNTYTVWNVSWCPTNSTSTNQVTYSIKIYGVKLF